MRRRKSPSIIFLAPKIWRCEWPCDAFLQVAGIYEDFYYLADNAGITEFINDKCDQQLLLTNIFMQNFHFHARISPPSVEFYLYDEHKEMSLYDFCWVCRIPFEGSLDEPHHKDVECLLTPLLLGNRGRVPMRESLAYVFLFCATTHYLLGDV